MPNTGSIEYNAVNNCSCGHAFNNHHKIARTCDLCIAVNPADLHDFGPPAAFSGTYAGGGDTPQTLSSQP